MTIKKNLTSGERAWKRIKAGTTKTLQDWMAIGAAQRSLRDCTIDGLPRNAPLKSKALGVAIDEHAPWLKEIAVQQRSAAVYYVENVEDDFLSTLLIEKPGLNEIQSVVRMLKCYQDYGTLAPPKKAPAKKDEPRATDDTAIHAVVDSMPTNTIDPLMSLADELVGSGYTLAQLHSFGQRLHQLMRLREKTEDKAARKKTSI